jgi:hypothetical protein
MLEWVQGRLNLMTCLASAVGAAETAHTFVKDRQRADCFPAIRAPCATLLHFERTAVHVWEGRRQQPAEPVRQVAGR